MKRATAGAADRPKVASSRVLVSRLLCASGLLSAAIGLAVACEEAGNSTAATSTGASDAGVVFDVPGDGTNFCGNEVHKVSSKPPLLYFVMDTSGSMSAKVSGSTTRYDVLKVVSVDLVSKLGHLVRVGAAAFPKLTPKNTCGTGGEVMAPQAGGSAATKALDAALTIDPGGGTPTAATLEAIAPKFAQAGQDPLGPEAVLLVTDGGPNCDDAAVCAASECIPNIDGVCPMGMNCCDPAMGGTGGNCLDRIATLKAIQDVVKGGAKLYVIGLAVGSAYESTLQQMALLGGGAQPTAPFYYPVDDLGKLEDTFRTIVSSLISCELTLADPPAQRGLTNVYFDGSVVVQDQQNGWVWGGTGNDKIVLVGSACSQLKTGGVQDVQVITGCPTETPK